MPTKHDPPKPAEGERTKRGRPARRSGRPSNRQRAIHPARLRRVADEMLAGKDYNVMQRELAIEWKVTTRTVRGYRARVLAEMREQLEEAGYLEPGLETILGVSRLEQLYAGALAAKDHRTALHVVRTRMLVAGVLGPTKHVHTFTGTAPIQVSATIAPAPGPVEAAKMELARKLAKRVVHKEPATLPAKGNP